MKQRSIFFVVCAALLVAMCMPAAAAPYSNYCSNIYSGGLVDNWSWVQNGGSSGPTYGLIADTDSTNGGDVLKLVHNLTTHAGFIRRQASADSNSFNNGYVTVIVKMRTANDQSPTAWASGTNRFSQTVGICYTVGKAAVLSVLPTEAAMSSTSGSQFETAGSLDNTGYHTWYVVAHNAVSNNVAYEVYRDGRQVLGGSMNSTVAGNLKVGGVYVDEIFLGTNPVAATGSWRFDRVAYRTGGYLPYGARDKSNNPVSGDRWDPWAVWSISGTVRNCDTGEPVPGATVALVGTTDTVTSDTDGNYEIAVPGLGSWNLKASKLSFTDATITVDVTAAGQVQFQDIPICPTSCRVQGVITVAGTTTPVAGATVSLRSGTAAPLFGTTIGDGSYFINGVPLGTYDVTVSAVGYAPKKLAPVVVALPSPKVVNASLALICASTRTVSDSFPGPTDLGSGWITASLDDPPTTDTYTFDAPGLLRLAAMPGHGISIADFSPANIDCTLRINSITGGGGGYASCAGITYRQPSPCTYDSLYGQTGSPGYFVWCAADGSSISLWRNGVVLASGPGITDWSTGHDLRVIAYGCHHWVLLDGMKIIDTTDSGNLSGGYVGINRNSAVAVISSISVSQLCDGGTCPTATLTGTVSDVNTSAGLGGGVVQLASGSHVNTSATPPLGTYTISLDSLDDQQVTFDVPGYTPQTLTLSSLTIGATTLNVAMTPDPCLVASPAAARAKASGCVTLLNQVITAQWTNNTLYLEDPKRASGIKVVLSAAVTNLQSLIGEVTSVKGTLMTDANGEVYIGSASFYQIPGIPITTNYLQPVIVTGKAFHEARGPDLIGLDVSMYGRVTATDWVGWTPRTCSYFNIDDGTGAGEVRVDVHSSLCSSAVPYRAGAFQGPAVGDYVEVEGIVSCDTAAPSGRALRIWHPNGNILLWDLGSCYGNGDLEGDPGPAGWGSDTSSPTFTAAASRGAAQNGHSPSSTTYMALTNATDGRGIGQIGRFFTTMAVSSYNTSGPMTNMPLVGTEYEMSCFVKGMAVADGSYFGFYDSLASADPNNPAIPNSYRIPIPIGTYDWTKLAGTYRYEGVIEYWNWPQNTGKFECQIVLENTATELDVDDFYLGYARGTMHFVNPTHYLHYWGGFGGDLGVTFPIGCPHSGED